MPFFDHSNLRHLGGMPGWGYARQGGIRGEAVRGYPRQERIWPAGDCAWQEGMAGKAGGVEREGGYARQRGIARREAPS